MLILEDFKIVFGWESLAPPFVISIFFVYYNYFLGGGVWATRVGLWLDAVAWSSKYSDLLKLFSKIFDNFFSKKLFSFKSFDKCAVISLMYGVVWFIVGQVESNKIFSSGFVKYGALIGFFTAALIYFIIYSIKKSRNYIFNPMFPHTSIFLHCYVKSIEVPTWAIPIGVFSAAIISSSVIDVIDYRFLSYKFIIGVFYMVMFLVWINALFDWISWGLSRWMIRSLISDIFIKDAIKRNVLIFFHITIDILFSLLSLLGLALILFFASGGDTWIEARENPFSLKGSTFSIMLLSTLVPTAIHLFCAIFAFIPSLPFGHRYVASFIPAKYEDFEPMDKAIVAGWLTLWTLVSMFIIYSIFYIAAQALNILSWEYLWDDGQNRDFWRSLFYLVEVLAEIIRTYSVVL